MQDKVTGVAVSGSYAYVSYAYVGEVGWVGGLVIIDISNPYFPVEVGFLVTGGAPHGVAVSGSYAYLADGNDGLRIIDVSIPSSPVEVGFFGTGNYAYGIAVRGSYAYVADGENGMNIIQNDLLVVSNDDDPSLPESFELNQNYPNPFNPSTTISYALPEQSNVKLTVFDVRGQEITTLLDADKPEGNYEVQWNGMDQKGNPVSTGVYLCRLESGTISQTIKMVYLR